MNQYTFNALEQDAFMEMMNVGFIKSADALAMILKEEVLIKCVEELRPMAVFSGMTENHIDLRTAIKGDISGTCHFIINKQDALYLINKVFKRDNNELILNEMETGFLLELDNILSASVISELANFMQLNIYGEVPEIKKWENIEHVDALLENYHPLFMKTEFRTKSIAFTPGFYWFLEPKIIETFAKSLGK